MRFLAIFLTMLLVSCAGTAYDYRGITSKSTCAEAVVAEQEQGSVFLRQEEDPEIEGLSDHILEGTLFSEPVEIRVTCVKNEILMGVNYSIRAQRVEHVKELHRNFERELIKLYGEPVRNTLFHSSAYAENRELLPHAKPWKHVSSWCLGNRLSVGILSYLWYGEFPYYSVAVGADFGALTCK